MRLKSPQKTKNNAAKRYVVKKINEIHFRPRLCTLHNFPSPILVILPIAFMRFWVYNMYVNKRNEVFGMIILVCILAWLLLCAWVGIILIGVEEKYNAEEWIGAIFVCLFSPLICLLIIKPIVKFFRKNS